MKIKLLLLITISTIQSINILSQRNISHLTFNQIDSLSIEYLKQNQTDSAILVMEYALNKYTEHEENITGILGYLYTEGKYFEKALKNWNLGVNKGYFYGLQFNRFYKNNFKENKVYKKLGEIDKQNGDSLDNISHLKYEVLLPENYSIDKTYPVLFVFHGNGRNIPMAKTNWKSVQLKSKFITVYLQSYSHVSRYNYKWNANDEKIRTEFTDIYNQITGSYPVDNKQIILAGMSAGGRTALEFAFKKPFYTKGVVANCPVIPKDINDDEVKDFVQKDKKLAIITGDNDWAFEKQKELIQRIEANNLKSKLIINKNKGHEFTNKFSNQLDECLKWLSVE